MRGGARNPKEGRVVETYVLVLNAGSSSLKFSVFEQNDGAAWQVGSRGQVEGIGTSPRLSVKNDRGETLIDQKLESSVRDGRAAIDILSGWLRTTYRDGRILGVGHRVVHGGPRFSSPVVVTREILAELNALTPLAPLHQPH